MSDYFREKLEKKRENFNNRKRDNSIVSKINLAKYLEQKEEIKQEQKIEIDLQKVQKSIDLKPLKKE